MESDNSNEENSAEMLKIRKNVKIMKLEKISRIPDIPKDFLDSENYLEFPRNFLKISRFPGT